VSAAPSAAATQPASCQSETPILDGGFEEPVIPAGTFAYANAPDLRGWVSNDPLGVELWTSGFLGVPAGAGNQFTELNSTTASTVYQDVATTPGQSLRWSLLHRGRGGVDVMDVVIGSPSGPMVSQGDLSDGDSAWGRHSGGYLVPAGQTLTRIGFRAVSTANGDVGFGNVLDDVVIETGPCVVTSAAASNVSRPGEPVRVGDLVEYTVTVENRGGSDATELVLDDILPSGVDVVPGSIAVTTGPDAGPRTDAVSDDQAEYVSGTRSLTARLGTGADSSVGGSLAAGQSIVVTYLARISAPPGPVTVSATLGHTDPFTGARMSAVASVVVTADAADDGVPTGAPVSAPAGAPAAPAQNSPARPAVLAATGGEDGAIAVLAALLLAVGIGLRLRSVGSPN
jgi:uncharacterized repeat protein (TIGR01451 family)